MVQKKAIFPSFFLGNIGQENVFYDILQRKSAFQGYKNKTFKKSKNWHFSKGVKPCFLCKNDHFFNFFFFGNIDEENIFFDILKGKNAFLGYEKINKTFKKSKNWHFSKGVNPRFWSKNGHFFNIFFRQYRPGKCLLRYSTTKKRLSRLLKQDVQKVEKLTSFLKGLNPWFWSKNGHFSNISFRQYS